MGRNLTAIVTLSVLLAGSIEGIHYYLDLTSQQRELTQQISDLEQKRDQLLGFVDRLTSERRVAKVLVIDQQPADQTISTTFLWVEYASDGSTLAPRQFTVLGDEVHFDAEVIKFDHDFVEANDPLKGHSIALFTRVFGSYQTPSDGFPIDTPGQEPDIYKGVSSRQSEFERDLWRDFWKLYDDEAYRKKMGVRVAQGESPWGRLEMGQLYTITVESDGGVNLSHEPVDPIYVAALARQTHLAATQPASEPAIR
jgi:hypothetical protein